MSVQGCARFQEISFNPCKSSKGACFIQPCRKISTMQTQYTVLYGWVELACIFSDFARIEGKL